LSAVGESGAQASILRMRAVGAAQIVVFEAHTNRTAVWLLYLLKLAWQLKMALRRASNGGQNGTVRLRLLSEAVAVRGMPWKLRGASCKIR